MLLSSGDNWLSGVDFLDTLSDETGTESYEVAMIGWRSTPPGHPSTPAAFRKR
jgi:hypothetical protein